MSITAPSPHSEMPRMPFGISRGTTGAVLSVGATTHWQPAPGSGGLDHPPIARAPQSPTCSQSSLPCARYSAPHANFSAAAPLQVNVVCFDLHRQVCVLAPPAMAWCPGLLTAPPRRGAASVPPALLVRFSLPLRRAHRSRSRWRCSLSCARAACSSYFSRCSRSTALPCIHFAGNSAPAGASLLPRVAAQLSGSGTLPCSLPHSARRILPPLIST